MAYNYEDQSKEIALTKKDLNILAWRSLLLQASFNYERMQSARWLYSILPGLRKIHKNKKDLSTAMKEHMEFFNTHPFLVTFIMGIILAMEQNKEDRDAIRGIKVATMGPLGGVGDALFWLTLLPITAGIGASLAMDGNILGPFIFLILFNIVHFGLRFGLMRYGYQTGVKAIQKLKEGTRQISRAASIIGLSVVGGLIATYVNFKLSAVVKTGKAKVDLQADLLDKIMPALLPLAYTLLMYYLLKKGKSPLILIGITIILGLAGKLLHFL
ncbi:PTS system mannose/fructose/sorbose family transporter subunit IID [Caldibacillus debilis]|uniref:PTS system mannose/fructose/sorbose family transporter subunit IID n=1 Tax=Caldibacillus debilis TaxID=301148 RepID=UPI000E3A7C0F|nr:PTS system mannose/fructose/sorbose family transporter subunit IID [Caldibacillus debilis]REJ31153.1 MAG: PTS N-acetylgalactosamine transporter subunit IID [Caldibacillus debilis]